MSARLARLAMRAYPPSFRERYEPELEALVEETGSGARVTADLLLGAIRAWVRPTFSGTAENRVRGRVQATACTVWIALCAGFLVAPATGNLFNDPMPMATPLQESLLLAAEIAMATSLFLALVAAADSFSRIWSRAMRAKDWRTLAPLGLPVALAIVDGIVALVISSITAVESAEIAVRSPLFVVLLVAFALGFTALVVSGALAPALVLNRAGLHLRELRLARWLSLPIALTLAAATALCLVAVSLTGWFIPVEIVALGVASVASIVALVSASRGIRASIA